MVECIQDSALPNITIFLLVSTRIKCRLRYNSSKNLLSLIENITLVLSEKFKKFIDSIPNVIVVLIF